MAVKDLTFGGQESFRAAPEQVFTLLTDLEQMQRTIPDLTSAERIDEYTLKCVVRPGFSFLRGTMNLTISLAELVRAERATMQIAARGIGAQLEIVSNRGLRPSPTARDWIGRPR